jgi:hypothetical protein
MLQFCIVEHYHREELTGTKKGDSILMQLMQINTSLMESVKIKTAENGATL